MLIRIDEFNDPRLAPYLNVREAHLRADSPVAPGGRFIAEGEVVLRVLLESPMTIESLLTTPTRIETIGDCVESLGEGTPVYLVEQALMDEITGFHIHRGLLAVGIRGEQPSLRALIERQAQSGGTLVLLEDLANHDNVGGLFRNAGAFGAAGVILSPRSADPLYRKAIRVSAGQALRVPFRRAESWAEELRALRDAGVELLALTPDLAAMSLEDVLRLDPPGGGRRRAILLGAEGSGLTSDTRSIADYEVRIEQSAEVDSLNVGIAGAIALYRLNLGAEPSE